MDSKKFLGTSILIAAILVAVLIAGGCATKTGSYDDLAQCLTAHGVIMYGASWCTHCQAQKKMFGPSFEYVTFIDCDKDAADCNAAGITGYPTWVINGTKYEGEQNFYTLAKNSGCIENLTGSTAK